MSAVTASATPTRAPQWLRVYRHLARAYGSMVFIWFWAMALPVVAIILFIVSRNVDVEVSGVSFTFHGALWFPFSLAIVVATSYLPIHVANGMTRRSFSRAALTANLTVGVGSALIATAALLVEERIYDALGWLHADTFAGNVLGVFHDGVLTYFVGLAFIFTAGQLSGSLVGIVYYRYGGWLGTLLLPVTLAPLAAIGFLALDQDSQWTPWDISLSTTWGEALAVLILLASAVAFHLVARATPIATRRA